MTAHNAPRRRAHPHWRLSVISALLGIVLAVLGMVTLDIGFIYGGASVLIVNMAWEAVTRVR